MFPDVKTEKVEFQKEIKGCNNSDFNFPGSDLLFLHFHFMWTGLRISDTGTCVWSYKAKRNMKRSSCHVARKSKWENRTIRKRRVVYLPKIILLIIFHELHSLTFANCGISGWGPWNKKRKSQNGKSEKFQWCRKHQAKNMELVWETFITASGYFLHFSKSEKNFACKIVMKRINMRAKYMQNKFTFLMDTEVNYYRNVNTELKSLLSSFET